MERSFRSVPGRLQLRITAVAAIYALLLAANNGTVASEIPASQPAGPVASPDLTVDGLEITQAIQDMRGSVVLVADKGTWVRAYVSAGHALGPVTAVLQASRSGSAPVTVLAQGSTNVGTATPLRERRESWGKSLNFSIPSSLFSAGVSHFKLLRVTNTTSGAQLDCGSCGGEVDGTFVETPPLRVHLVGLEYTGNTAAQTYAPRLIDYQIVESWLRRAYPVGRLVVTRGVVSARTGSIPKCGQANTQLTSLRQLNVAEGEDRRTHYLGLVSNGGGFMRGCSGVPTVPNPSSTASSPTGPTTPPYIPSNIGSDHGASFGGWYGGHELAHSFGRQHPGYCDQTTDDHSWPTNYVGGAISDAQGDSVGLDVGDSASSIGLSVLPGRTSYDIMTYCTQPQWLSDYTYRGIQERLSAENLSAGAPVLATLTADLVGDPQAPVAGKFVHVVASVNLTDRSGKIEYVFPLSEAAPQAPEEDQAELRALRADGTVIGKYSVALQRQSDAQPGDPTEAIVDAAVLETPDLRRIQLVLGGKVLDEFAATQDKPPQPGNLKGASPSSGSTPGAIKPLGMLLSWSPSKLKESVSYTIQVSDEGKHWRTIAVGVSSPTVHLPADDRKARFARVIATNGFKNSDPVLISLKPDSKASGAKKPTPPP